MRSPSLPALVDWDRAPNQGVFRLASCDPGSSTRLPRASHAGLLLSSALRHVTRLAPPTPSGRRPHRTGQFGACWDSGTASDAPQCGAGRVAISRPPVFRDAGWWAGDGLWGTTGLVNGAAEDLHSQRAHRRQGCARGASQRTSPSIQAPRSAPFDSSRLRGNADLLPCSCVGTCQDDALCDSE